MAGFLISTVNITLSYLPSHEAQHDIFARPGSRLRWLNEFIGHWSVIPMASGYGALRLTHLEHHRHTNDSELDPDYGTHAKNGWDAIWQSISIRQPGATAGFNGYARTLQNLGTPQAKRAILESVMINLVFYGVLFSCAWSGFALEAALLWWLPRHIALTYIQFFLSWAPHHPAQERGRYSNTRGFRSVLGNIGSLGMQYHIVHHLHPRIPLFRTGPAYWEMRDILEKRKCDLGRL